MEFTSSQLLALNAKLPSGFKINTIVKKESKNKHRKSELENLDFNNIYIPREKELRPARVKRQVSIDSFDTLPKQSDSFKKIYKILQAIKKHEYSEPFLEPVNPKLVPDYHTVIKEPMDLSTVEKKLRAGEYETGYHFAMDMRLIWSNSFQYNAKNSDLYAMTMELSSHFETLMKGNENVMLADKQDVMQDLYQKIEKLSKGMKEIQANKVNPQAASTSAIVKVPAKPPVEKPMTLNEKKVLCSNIKKLDPKYLKGVLDIVQECMNVQGEELEFDIDKLPSNVCRELEKYVKQCLANASRSQSKKKTKSINIDGMKSIQEMTSSRLKDLDQQLEQLSQNKKPETQPPQQPVAGEESSSDSSSSSSSEDEEELPMPTNTEAQQQQMFQNPYNQQIPTNSWNMFGTGIDGFQDFSVGNFGGLYDFDKTDYFK